MSKESVKVVVRCRPFNSLEKTRKCQRIVEIDQSAFSVTLWRNADDDHDTINSSGGNGGSGGGKIDPKTFTFDAVYDHNSTQREVYEQTAAPLVESVMEGYNATVFAYGQTGCGKTFTMEGLSDPPEMQGIIPNAFRHVFDRISLNDKNSKQFLVRASYIEIYNEEVRDLLGNDPKARLELKEDKEGSVSVKGVTQTVVKDASAIMQLMRDGNKNRTVGATLMNQDSSRSHSIFMVNVETSEPNDKGESHIRAGKLNLVDLAGSERQSKTGASGTRLKEATKINLSLSALGNVISALVAGGGKHVPYRDSKLTRLLQDSLGGNTKTTMIAACSPADYNYEETLSTLRYANRAKDIKNKPKINEDPKDALLREYQQEISRLRALLDGKEIPAPPVSSRPAEPAPSSSALKIPPESPTNHSQQFQELPSFSQLQLHADGFDEEQTRTIPVSRQSSHSARSTISHPATSSPPSTQTSPLPPQSPLSPDVTQEQQQTLQEQVDQQQEESAQELQEEDQQRESSTDHHHVVQFDGKTVKVMDEETVVNAQATLSRELRASEQDQRKLLEEKIRNEQMMKELEEEVLAEKKLREQLASELASQTEQAQELRLKREQLALELEQRLQEERARAAQLAERMQQEQSKHDELSQKIQEFDLKQKQAEEEKIGLKEKLQALESQLLIGGQLAQSEKEKIQDQLQKAAEKLKQERELKEKITQEKAKADEIRVALEENYSTIQQEVEDKTLKLERLRKKFSEVQQENKDLQAEHQAEKSEYLASLRDYERQLSLHKQILQRFISPKLLHKIIKIAKWNAASDEWLLPANCLPSNGSDRRSSQDASFFASNGGLDSTSSIRSGGSTNAFSFPPGLSARGSLEGHHRSGDRECDEHGIPITHPIQRSPLASFYTTPMPPPSTASNAGSGSAPVGGRRVVPPRLISNSPHEIGPPIVFSHVTRSSSPVVTAATSLRAVKDVQELRALLHKRRQEMQQEAARIISAVNGTSSVGPGGTVEPISRPPSFDRNISQGERRASREIDFSSSLLNTTTAITTTNLANTRNWTRPTISVTTAPSAQSLIDNLPRARPRFDPDKQILDNEEATQGSQPNSTIALHDLPSRPAFAPAASPPVQKGAISIGNSSLGNTNTRINAASALSPSYPVAVGSGRVSGASGLVEVPPSPMSLLSPAGGNVIGGAYGYSQITPRSECDDHSSDFNLDSPVTFGATVGLAQPQPSIVNGHGFKPMDAHSANFISKVEESSVLDKIALPSKPRFEPAAILVGGGGAERELHLESLLDVKMRPRFEPGRL